MHNRDRTFYQYALLNLAILQADFGCYSEALAAMRETIATARENKDLSCLNFSLSWLYHFGKVHPGEVSQDRKGSMMGVEREGLAFLKAKAKENGMWGLMATSLLSEAKMVMANVSFRPSPRKGGVLFMKANTSHRNARVKIWQKPLRISCRART